MAKTTKEETMHHKGCAVKVSAAMKDTMEGAPEMVQGHVLVVVPQPGVQRRIHLHLHLHTPKGHQEVMQPSVARQCVRGLAAHLELQCLSFRARSLATRWYAVYRSPRWWYPRACTVS